MVRGYWLMAWMVGVAAAQTPSGTLVVVNQKEHSVELVDAASRKVVGVVPVGVNGHEVAISPDGKFAYVPIYGNAGVGRPGTDGREIDVIDLKAQKMVGTIDFGKALRPHKPVFGPDGLLYVSGELADSIEVVDPKQRKVLGEIPTGADQTHMFVLSKDGTRAYTANVGDGSVSVLDVKARKLITVIHVAKKVQRMAISADGRWVFTSDQDQPRVAVIDTRTNQVSRWVPTSGIPYVTQPMPDGKKLLIAETKDGKGVLEVVDMATWQVVKSYPLASTQNGGFLVRGDTVYLSEPPAGTIEVLDTKRWELEKPIVMTPGVDGLGWAQ